MVKKKKIFIEIVSRLSRSEFTKRLRWWKEEDNFKGKTKDIRQHKDSVWHD
jgi:hypothetical protein